MSSRTTRSQTSKASHSSVPMAGASNTASKKRSRSQSASKPQKRSKTANATPTIEEPHKDQSNATNKDSDATPNHAAESSTHATENSDQATPTDPITTAFDTKPSTHITLTESTGDIFSAPANTLLIHACNTQGTWNAGIASAFKAHYPAAYSIYQGHCKKWGESLLSSALLIPPPTTTSTAPDKRHFIGCLFTSAKRGKGKGSVNSILEATGPAMEDLMRQVKEDGRVGKVRMCKINSGLFRVPWQRTRAVIEELEMEEGMGREIAVVTLEDK